MMRFAIALSLALLLGALACASPEGPLLALPPQDIAARIPEGKARVIFLNMSSKLLYFESGPIKITLNGQQVPSLWLDHYAQVFVDPGTYPLHLEHYDAVMWKDDYTIEIRAPQTIVKIWNRPTSTRFEILDALPANFATRFLPRGPRE